MMSDSSFTGFNMDSYLNLLKPKPVVPKTYQQIFDKVAIQMVRQKVPCIRMDYTDDGVDVYLTKFNSSGSLSPLLAVLEYEDIRILRKTIGYDFLQTELRTRNVLRAYDVSSRRPSGYNSEMWNRLSPSVQEKTLVVKAMLESRGILTVEQMDFLENLDLAHQSWYDRMYSSDFTSQTSHVDMDEVESTMVSRFTDFDGSNRVSLNAITHLCP